MSDSKITGQNKPSQVDLVATEIGGLETDASKEKVSVAPPEKRRVEYAATPQIANESTAVSHANPATIQQQEYVRPDKVNAEYLAFSTVATLADRNCSPSALFDVLSNQAVSSGTPETRASQENKNCSELRAQLNRLTPMQRSEIAQRLDAKAMVALHQAANEGVGLTKVKDRQYTAAMLRGTVRHLAMIRNELGLAAPQQEITPKNAARARETLEAFMGRIDDNQTFVRGKVEPEFLEKIAAKFGTSPDEKDGSAIDSRVCVAYDKDISRSFHVLEHADGSREWVVPPDILTDSIIVDGSLKVKNAAKRLDEFIGGNNEKLMTASRLMNQSLLACATFAYLKRNCGFESAAMPDGKKIDLTMGAIDPVYICKDNGDGTLTVSGVVSQKITACISSEEKGLGLLDTNQNQSEFNAEIKVDIDAEGNAKIKDLNYQIRLTGYTGLDPEVSGFIVEGNSHETPSMAETVPHLANKLGIPEQSNIMMMGANPTTVDRLTALEPQDLAVEINRMHQGGLIEDRVHHFLVAGTKVLAELGREAATSLGNRDITVATGLIADLKALQSDLVSNATDWVLDHSYGDIRNDNATVNATAGLVGAIEQTLDVLSPTLAEVNVEADDLRGNLDEQATASLLSRANLASIQAKANFAAVSDLYYQVTTPTALRANPKLEDQDQAANLVSEFAARFMAVTNELDQYAAGQGSMPTYGPGVADGKEFNNLTSALLRDLKAGKQLPLSHPRLSEAQLISVRLQHFVNQNPDYASFMANYAESFRNQVREQLANGDWSSVKTHFVDVDSAGQVRPLTSTITPAPSIAEPSLQANFEGKGVPAFANTQINHAANLAVTTLHDAAGQEIFTGLRHAVLDAYELDGKALMASSTASKNSYVQALSRDSRFTQLAAENNATSFNDLVALLGNAEHADSIASWAREIGSNIAASELVHVAVASNPTLRAQALAGEPVTVHLDSVSMLAPGGTDAGQRNGISQANQQVAIARLGAVNIKLTNDKGHEHLVKVQVVPRQFNFAVRPPEQGESLLQPIIGKGPDWNKMDATNQAALTDMLGDLRSPNLGGEVDRVLAYLEGREIQSVDETTKRSLQIDETTKRSLQIDKQQNVVVPANATRSALVERRAVLITDLASQIKTMYNNGGHRKAGNEPYKMVSRIAMLSNLLGNTTAFNCRNGLDHTSQLDAEIKQLGSTLSAPYRVTTNARIPTRIEVPKPDAQPDYARKSKFLMSTGQLQMEEKNTGLRAFKLRFPFFQQKVSGLLTGAITALRNRFNSPLTQQLYSNQH